MLSQEWKEAIGDKFVTAALRHRPYFEMVALRHQDDHNRRIAHHLSRHGLAPYVCRDQPERQLAELASSLGGGGGFGGQAAFCQLGLLAW